VLTFVPTPLTVAMMATEMPAAMRPYSMALVRFRPAETL
jgi:hypothetical protein